MTRSRILCIFTALLGNKATAQLLRDALNGLDGLDITSVLLTIDDYQRYPAGRWSRTTAAWESRHIARMKMRELREDNFDFLLVNTWEFVIEFRRLAQRIPAAALMDAVPKTVDDQVRRRGSGGWKRALATGIHDVPFRKAVRDFKCFLPMGSDCADALVSHYGIPRERCFVTLAPQDLKFWTPGTRKSADRLRLLFVGNDFVRKGGDFLLRLFAEALSGWCTLTIVSNDVVLRNRVLPSGAVWVGGLNRDQVRQAYRESDLLLLPTQQDYMPQVLAEALSVGLPCMANDVGAIRDVVRDGETGFLMARDAPASAWAQKIELLRSSPAAIERLSKGARDFAERNLDADRFGKLVGEVVERLRVHSRAGV